MWLDPCPSLLMSHLTWECMRMLWMIAAACICMRCSCLAAAAASKWANRVDTLRWSPAQAVGGRVKAAAVVTMSAAERRR